MKKMQRWVWAMCLGLGLLAFSAGAEEAAVVKKNRVNVRAQATPDSEVITQLKKGETVTVLEEIAARKPKRGEPTTWARIQLPPNTPVWVYAPYIETTNNSVNIKRLNLRAGPGERFSIIGRIDRGTTVKQIRTTDNWMEIEAPPNAYAFVAAEMLEKSAASTPPQLAATTTPPAPAQPPPTVETVKPETAPAVATEPVPAPTQAAAPVAPEPAPTTAVETAAPKRVVSREGTVVVSRSIQAPTSYALEHRESRRTVNYLHSESEDIDLKRFAGKKVIVMGEELIDHRWVNTPIIEVESIRLLP